VHVHDINVHVHAVLVPAENDATREPHFADLEFSTRFAGFVELRANRPGALEEE